ncbi:MAG: hypothetical protein MUC98_17390, partial [Desulfobacterota bacterium]|nr:hypothetical protein [Thermodesulfobacteriota bacterium]
MLTLDAGHGLFHIGEDRSLKQVGSLALFDEAAEDGFVKGVCDGLAFLLRIGLPLEGGKKLLLRVHQNDGHPEFFHGRHHGLRLPFAHE